MMETLQMREACAEIPSWRVGGRDRGAAENLRIKTWIHE